MKVPWSKKILDRGRIRVFMVAVIRPIGLACPVFCEANIEAGIRLQPFRIQRAGRSVRRDDKHRTAGARQICAKARGQTPIMAPVEVEMTEMRIVCVYREL